MTIGKQAIAALAALSLFGFGAAASAATDLSGYVGKYPFDKVGGVSFIENPAVQAAVKAAVPDARARKFVLSGDGPSPQIVLKDGRLLVSGAQDHNTSGRNWYLAISPSGDKVEVCVYDSGANGGRAVWGQTGQKPVSRDGDCPSTSD